MAVIVEIVVIVVAFVVGETFLLFFQAFFREWGQISRVRSGQGVYSRGTGLLFTGRIKFPGSSRIRVSILAGRFRAP